MFFNHKKEGVKAKSVVGIGVKAGVLGMTAAGTLATGVLIKPWEGRSYVAYKDPIGIWTYCDGITDKTHLKFPPYKYTDAECDVHLSREVNAHEQRLDVCLNTPTELPIETKAAFISWTFNVGSGAACKSTLVRLANQGNYQAACDQLSRWTRAGGRVFRGLENRRFRGDVNRISEKTLCMIGLDPSYKSPLFERIYIGFKNWKTNTSKQEAQDV